MIYVSVINLKDIVERIGNIGDTISREIYGATKYAIEKTMLKDAKELCPVRTGSLSRSIDFQEIAGFYGVKGQPGVSFSFGPGLDYGVYVEFGTGERGELGRSAYEIKPRHKKALWWRGLPHPIRRVKRHPGMASRPFMRPAFDKNTENLPLLIEMRLREKLISLGKAGGKP